ncbi:MAG: aspartate 1-decarboxylase [Comamonas sp.]
MFRMLMNSKIHRAQVTQADLNYVGSITIDQDLMDAVGIVANEKVHVVNNNNGARFETYVIAGARASGVVCVNGAAARLVQKGDIVIIIAYAYVSAEEMAGHVPRVAIMGADNRIRQMLHEEPALTML